MILKGIEYGPVWGASGVQGFFDGGEYVYHRVLRAFGMLDMRGMTFVAKTVTLLPTEGNMPVRTDGITPAETRPACVHVTPGSWWRGHALNKVGLTNPGAEELLARGKWQRRTRPFALSFMQVASCPGDPERERRLRLEEMEGFVRVLERARRSESPPRFQAPFALQINFSCPNAGQHAPATVRFVRDTLDIASQLAGVPIVPKLSVDASVVDAAEIAEHPACDALCVSNTVPWGALRERLDWNALFGTIDSPLRDLGKPGGGGLSGAPLLSLVEDWIRRARRIGITKPVNGGGGILGPADAERVVRAGASSVFIGSMAFLRPWRVQSTIRHAARLLGEADRASRGF